MRIGLYTNRSKDVGGIRTAEMHKLLSREEIEYIDIADGDFSVINPVEGSLTDKKIDLLIVLGGDGTILGLTTYAAENDIPIIGINAGKLGFLTEFESFEMERAVKLIKNGELKEDERIILKIDFAGDTFYALNDCVVQRMFAEENTGTLTANVTVTLDGNLVDRIVGDGLIVSTPTGSTAYSLSAGGPILAPGIESFGITPISAHSLHHRPIIYSSESVCCLTVGEGGVTGLFCDGKQVGRLVKGDTVTVTRAAHVVKFLRKKDSNFYNRLLSKLNSGRVEK